MAWAVETLNETVDAELSQLPADMRARLVRISELIESVDLPNVKEPHGRHVCGPLWEIRLKGKAGIARALSRVATGRGAGRRRLGWSSQQARSSR
jgi:hypothetical protein